MLQQALERFPGCTAIAVSGHFPGQDPIGHTFGERFAKLSKPAMAEALAVALGVVHQDNG